MAVTRKDVAAHCGVPVSTVGVILSGRGDRYSEQTRQKVLEAARQLNYRPHIHARGLRLNRSFLIGVSLFAGNSGVNSELMRGVQEALSDEDYLPLVFSCRDAREQADCLRRFHQRQVDGMIITATGGDAKRDLLVGQDIPVVEILGTIIDWAPSVNIDYVTDGRAATEHLISLGHHRIAMLTHARYERGRGEDNSGAGAHYDAWQRFVGYGDAMTDAGLTPIVLTHPISGEIDVMDEFVVGGHDAMGALLEHQACPTAVVCYNDLEAYGLILAARQCGVDLPRSLSVIGYGDLTLSRIISPALATQRVPAYEIGRIAVASLLQSIDKQAVQSSVIESKLIVRESVAEPPIDDR